ncbi:magnesium transporter [Thermococcus waiotapuensis]|uniref:Magnesium transporter n=1 Tax=Thermococcus waiotapuensis TaxID=90909 RepID=A0AAE4NX83_9EURY|nr:magnesium transporter [Thermococcus waiotapuensis]MDV3104523.1 magnesium transporter [Thermococcus waiotapuensis]
MLPVKVTVGTRGWRERLKQTFLVTFPALLLCLALDFVGGGVLGKNFEMIVTSYPLLLIILPGLNDLRGNVFGAMASRMTTALHLGKIRGVLDKEVTTNVSIAIGSSKIPLIILWIAGTIKLGFPDSAFVVLLIVIASALVVGLLLGYSTAIITVFSYRWGADPDMIAAPLITSVADVITIPSLVYLVFFYESNETAFYAFTALMIALLVLLILRSKYGREHIKAFKEIGGVLTGLAILEIFSGSMLESYSDFISQVIILSVMYPSILDSVGNFASIAAATTSTRLNLSGESALKDREFYFDISALLLLTPIIGFLTNYIAVHVTNLIGYHATLIWPFILGYPFLVAANIAIGVIIALISFRFNIDPDNVGVPTVTTVADITGTLFVVLLAKMMVGA